LDGLIVFVMSGFEPDDGLLLPLWAIVRSRIRFWDNPRHTGFTWHFNFLKGVQLWSWHWLSWGCHRLDTLRPEEFPVAAIFPSVFIVSDDVLAVVDPEPEDSGRGGPPLGAWMLNENFLTLFK
jgi:hypothetical protein